MCTYTVFTCYNAFNVSSGIDVGYIKSDDIGQAYQFAK